MDRVSLLLGLILFMLISGCRRDGCTDINGVNFDEKANRNDGFCTYRYLKSINLIKIPEIERDESSISYYPNLKFYMKKTSEFYWEIETTVAFENRIYPYIWEVILSSDNYLFWEEEYNFLLSDEKFEGRDTIFGGTFIPDKLYDHDQVILMNSDLSCEIELNFVVF